MFEMVSQPLQLPAPFDLAKEIWPQAQEMRKGVEERSAYRRMEEDENQ